MQVREIINRQHFSINSYLNEQVDLFLLIEDSRISCSVFNSSDTVLIEICSLQFKNDVKSHFVQTEELQLFLNEFRLRNHSYKNISIQLLNKHFTLIPNSYAGESTRELLSFNTGIKDLQNVHSTVIGNEICFAYTVDHALYQFLEKNFNTAKISHAGAVSLELFIKLPQFKQHQLFLNIHSDLIEIIIKKEQKLLFYNIFTFNSHEDILYFVLFAIEQNMLDASKLHMTVAGNIQTNDHLINLLKKYIRHIDFTVSRSLQGTVEGLPNHFYFNILNKHLCEY